MDERHGRAIIEPITRVEHIGLDDLVGYELQKAKLIENTEAFIEGRAANNVLLFGDSGTGKSSSIKAILNEYYDRGLRMIEVYKHQFRVCPMSWSRLRTETINLLFIWTIFPLRNTRWSISI